MFTLISLVLTLTALFCPKASGTLRMNSREVWQAVLPAEGGKPMRQNVDCLMIHHTENNTPCNSREACSSNLRRLQKNHMETKGYVDIGYHYAIDSRGEIYKCRSRQMAGAYTFPLAGKCYQVALMGNYEERPPSTNMMNSLQDLVTYLQDKQNMSEEDMIIYTHKDGFCTECPGKAARRKLSQVFPKYYGKQLASYKCT